MRAGLSLGWVALGRGFAHAVTLAEAFGSLRGVVRSPRGDEAVPLGWQQRSDAGVRAACPAGGGLGRANCESGFLSK